MLRKVKDLLKSIKKPALTIYPILIILIIPILLIVNTIWNLQSFNRDANFIIRHQASSIGDTLKPIIVNYKDDPVKLTQIINDILKNNEDILSISVLKKVKDSYSVYISSDSTLNESELKTELNELALSFDQSFAGLSYDPFRKRDVWKVVLPLKFEDSEPLILQVVTDTQSVNSILERTTKDSTIILLILIVVILILLANHFYFYIRSLKTQQLEEIDKLKDDFISMAAHELRAPMTALLGYLELLRDKLSPDELTKVKSDLDTLNSLTQDLNSLITDLLDVSRIEQGRLSVEIADIDVNEIISEIVKVMLPNANEKHLQLLYHPSKLPLIRSDHQRIRQVVTNLISNSIKYTLKGTVTVETTIQDNTIIIGVKDTGIGIPPEHMNKLFGKFHRVQDKQTNEVRGTGLGLWITKQIVELLGGKIQVESIYGTGTSISFTLPITTV
jgi:signal transduction histidine kinase